MNEPRSLDLARYVLATLLLLNAVGCAFMTKVQEPAYVVQKEDAPFQIRHYEGRIVAETRVDGPWLDAGNEGFRRLASYIFGNNSKRSKVAMTAPVGERNQGRSIPMTAPVAERGEGQEWVVSFTMPREETLETLPEPKDPRVSLRELGPTTVAVVRFSGRWTEKNMEEHEGKLRAWLHHQGRAAGSPAEVQRFDPPWKPWFLRRNEIWVPLEETASRESPR
jgi:hypothetical protein